MRLKNSLIEVKGLEQFIDIPISTSILPKFAGNITTECVYHFKQFLNQQQK